MVIFHSYVSLPEGTRIMKGEQHTSSIHCRLQWFPASWGYPSKMYKDTNACKLPFAQGDSCLFWCLWTCGMSELMAILMGNMMLNHWIWGVPGIPHLWITDNQCLLWAACSKNVQQMLSNKCASAGIQFWPLLACFLYCVCYRGMLHVMLLSSRFLVLFPAQASCFRLLFEHDV